MKITPQSMGFEPLGGSSRSFRNITTGEIISRRQYDKLYGALKRGGLSSYEAKAKKKFAENPELALSRPAPGRKKIREPELNGREIARRKAKRLTRKIPTPKISSRMLEIGKKSVRVRCEWSLEAIRDVITQINNFPRGIIFAYFIGARAMDEDGNEHYVSLLPFTFYTEPFGVDEWDFLNEALNRVDNLKSGRNLFPISAFVQFTFETAFAQKNAERIRRKKKPKGLF
jgi:hypothetical protein